MRVLMIFNKESYIITFILDNKLKTDVFRTYIKPNISTHSLDILYYIK